MTSEVVTSTSEAVTSTMEAQSKHDEIQEKMAVTRGANMTKFKKIWPRHVAQSKHDEIREKKKKNPVASEASHVYEIQRAKRATYMRTCGTKRAYPKGEQLGRRSRPFGECAKKEDFTIFY